MQPFRDPHISEEDLERYAMGTLPESAAAAAEEHLLVCPACQERLAETDAYVKAMRAAARAERHRFHPARGWFRPALAMAAAACALLIAGVIRRPAGGAPVAVVLEATRGAMSGYAPAPARTPLWLDTDVSDLPDLPEYRVEVVNAGGSRVWEGRAGPRDGRLKARVTRGLAPGQYYVRLYEPSGGLLREFGLETRSR